MPDETYYSLLEISETESAAEIKTAYLRLIREVHPDRLANAPTYWQRQAEEKSKEINEAYAVLSNREKRCMYDAQLASYRSSRATAGRAPTSQPSTPPPNSTQQKPPAAYGSQSTSGAGTRSTQTTSSAPPPSNQASTPLLKAGQRLLFAFIGSIFAFGAAGAFWTSLSFGDGALPFLLATILSFGVACLYQSQLSRVFLALRVRPKQQLWATIGTIVFVLFVGKVANMNRDTHFLVPGGSSATTAQTSQVKMDDRSAAASAPAPHTLDVHDRDDPQPGSGARQSITKSRPESSPPQNSLQAAEQSSLPNNAQHVTAAAPVTAPPGASEVAVQQIEAPLRKSLSGIWVGKYTCGQGVTGLTLTIAESADGGLSGTFDFYPVPGGSYLPKGSYVGAVTAGPDGSFEFKPQRWVSQPPGYFAVGLSGHYLVDAQRLQGQVTGAFCTSFDLARQHSQALNASVPYDTSNLSASDRSSIESACSGARVLHGAAAYHQCLNTQLEELGRYPVTPDLSKLSSVDRNSIESACSGARVLHGAAAYHRCLGDQLSELGIR